MVSITSLRTAFNRIRLHLAGWGAVAGPEYHHFRNVILPTPRGTTEIDYLIVSRFGLFVIEFKDRSGQIYGKVLEPYWTAVHFKKHFKFQNPLNQNFGHLKALEENLGIELPRMQSIVVFRWRCQFMTPVPNNVFLQTCSGWLAQRKDVLLNDKEVEEVLRQLKERAVRGWFAAFNHARSVKRRYASTTTCPKCGGNLIERVARTGPMPGSRFLGCSNFPSCRYTRNFHAT